MDPLLCSCGHEVPRRTDVAACPRCGNQNFVCKECGAPLSIPAEDIAVACPYCGFELVKLDRRSQSLCFPPALDERSAAERLLWFLRTRFGVPADLEAEYRVDSASLVFLPIHVFTVRADSGSGILEVDTCTVPASRDVWFAERLRDYRFAVGRKIYRRADGMRGTVVKPTIGYEDARAAARAQGNQLAARDAVRILYRGEAAIDEWYGGMIHYPFYDVRYEYGGQPFHGVVDAVNGATVYCAYPLGEDAQWTVRTWSLLLFLLLLGAGGVESFLFGNLLPLAVTGVIGLVIGLMLVLRTRRLQSASDEFTHFVTSLGVTKFDYALKEPAKTLRAPPA